MVLGEISRYVLHTSFLVSFIVLQDMKRIWLLVRTFRNQFFLFGSKFGSSTIFPWYISL